MVMIWQIGNWFGYKKYKKGNFFQFFFYFKFSYCSKIWRFGYITTVPSPLRYFNDQEQKKGNLIYFFFENQSNWLSFILVLSYPTMHFLQLNVIYIFHFTLCYQDIKIGWEKTLIFFIFHYYYYDHDIRFLFKMWSKKKIFCQKDYTCIFISITNIINVCSVVCVFFFFIVNIRRRGLWLIMCVWMRVQIFFLHNNVWIIRMNDNFIICLLLSNLIKMEKAKKSTVIEKTHNLRFSYQ